MGRPRVSTCPHQISSSISQNWEHRILASQFLAVEHRENVSMRMEQPFPLIKKEREGEGEGERKCSKRQNNKPCYSWESQTMVTLFSDAFHLSHSLPFNFLRSLCFFIIYFSLLFRLVWTDAWDNQKEFVKYIFHLLNRCDEGHSAWHCGTDGEWVKLLSKQTCCAVRCNTVSCTILKGTQGARVRQ